MKKLLDLDKNVEALCTQFPELKEILADLGFKDIVKPLVLNTMGRIMTIPRGSAMKEIPMDRIIEVLEENGFQVFHVKADQEEIEKTSEVAAVSSNLSEKESMLQNYIKRLTEGEDIENVRNEFKENFSNVSALEIARAEQTLMKEGTPLEDVQRLCDIHSALFHGTTITERIAAAEKEVERNYQKEQLEDIASGFDNNIAELTAEFVQEAGHPLQILSLENQAIVKLLNEIDLQRNNGKQISELLDELKKLLTIAQHYGKKDELLFPLLKDKYGYTGPSDVMWGVEDEIRDQLRQIIFSTQEQKEESLTAVLKRIREMVYKEENILFPLCASCFTESEWIAIARDIPMFGPCLITEIPLWDKVNKINDRNTSSGNIVLPGGSMNIEQLRSMLNTLPMEITLIDENDINRFFNEGDKLFTRPTMAIGRPVYSCHPKRVEPIVRMLIHDFKTGKKDSMHIISEKSGSNVLINYYALRDENGTYLGTMEAVQKLDGIIKAIKKDKKGPIEI